MEKLASVLARYICSHSENSEFSYDVYRYSFLMLLEMAAGSVTGVLIAVYMAVLVEAAAFLLVFFLLRSYAGGLHCRTFLRCYFASSMILAGAFWLDKHWYAEPYISLALIMVFGSLLAFFNGCDSPNRPVSSEEAMCFKKKLHRILTVTFILYLAFLIFGYGQCALSVSLAVTASGLLMVIGKWKMNEKT